MTELNSYLECFFKLLGILTSLKVTNAVLEPLVDQSLIFWRAAWKISDTCINVQAKSMGIVISANYIKWAGNKRAKF